MTNQHQRKIHACLPQVLVCSSTPHRDHQLPQWMIMPAVTSQSNLFLFPACSFSPCKLSRPYKKQKGSVLLMPYPQESVVTVALLYRKSSLKQSENSRSYKAKNTGFNFFLFCHTKTTCRRIFSQKNGGSNTSVVIQSNSI